MQNVLGTRGSPECQELVICIGEHPATADRDQARVADFGKDHGNSLTALDAHGSNANADSGSSRTSMPFTARPAGVTDHAWVPIQRAVLQVLKDKDIAYQPLHHDRELEGVADTVADHVIGAIDKATRRLLANDEHRR